MIDNLTVEQIVKTPTKSHHSSIDRTCQPKLEQDNRSNGIHFKSKTDNLEATSRARVWSRLARDILLVLLRVSNPGGTRG
ncbi:MAG TPA: hypothetical protein PKD72_13200, partial [Gemmatales bacterium]|nr:hypothetical protein [Gemmatales bacterium]